MINISFRPDGSKSKLMCAIHFVSNNSTINILLYINNGTNVYVYEVQLAQTIMSHLNVKCLVLQLTRVYIPTCRLRSCSTGVNPGGGDGGDVSLPLFWVGGMACINIPPPTF